ncbi:restriction endonuclease [Vibrio fluvialis]|uniref:restriction endonuclease n=1 Tax=Vibrio fluvialis TaxID=676 RepID=UPI001F246E53|nr:restriction endonuclease [Vibrio fluvialis]MCE7657297.1 restriction endonuclease [Vibrio fluvialis]
MSHKPLKTADLVVDAIYEGSRNGNVSDEVLPHLLGVDNTGGFRYFGKPRTRLDKLKILVLITGFDEPEWPDSIDLENGVFTYYGDKRVPGDLHDTGRDGNITLRNLFDYCHSSAEPPYKFPAIFVFSKTKQYRDVKFLGLAVPGVNGMSSDEDLVAVWRQASTGQRFQNYKATFTILDCPIISREWINDIRDGNAYSSVHAPNAWKAWVKSRKYTPLLVEKPKGIRSKKEQIHLSERGVEVISLIHSKFEHNPVEFEHVAAKLVELAMPNSHSIEVTRPWRDGGRDALGKYRIGVGQGSIDVEFAVEAKCKKLTNGVGIQATSRLVSRLRHRQFGVLVTTSYLDKQAYQELITDEHPVVVMCAKDICDLLLERFPTNAHIDQWLDSIVSIK